MKKKISKLFEAFIKANDTPQKENGLLNEEQNKNAQGMQNALEKAPPEVIDCLIELLGSDMVQKLKGGMAIDLRSKQSGMDECFSQGRNGRGPVPCTTPEECKAYCDSHPEECDKPELQGPPKPEFQKSGPDMGPGPGGCQSQEECEAYCSAHREECGAPPPMPQDPNPNQNPDWRPPEGQMPPPMPGPGPEQPVSPQPVPAPESAPAPNENFLPPPPAPEQPSPVSKIINTDSLAGSLIEAAYKAIFK